MDGKKAIASVSSIMYLEALSPAKHSKRFGSESL